MIRSFADLYAATASLPRRRMVVAAAQDLEVLQAVEDAATRKLVEVTLIGDGARIQEIAGEHQVDISKMEVVDISDYTAAAREAVRRVSSGEAHMLMKGILDSATLLRQVLDREIGLRTGRLLCHVAVMEIPQLGRLLLMTDGGMVIAPNLEEKTDMLKNAFDVARGLGINQPKAVPITALEQVNPKMPATVDAAKLQELAASGEFGDDVLVSGPLAFDGALDPEAARHKGIKDPVAGLADILLMPYIEVGNVFYKALVRYAQIKVAGIIVGAKAPIVLVSRSDTPEAKCNSIALASYLARD
ncbi:MAG: bifunctional enoyl-CoA hydratase/phosphate acetyltransferase [Symbiobacteriaceae bacterium]|nr:bifunctional enoyl-CoA hydratase/phosphate acetyltransferase [Symbiobacteriaceae bacterium]